MADVNAAADVMGVPAELVSRSAAARAAASGMSTEEVLDAWSGGGSIATKTEPSPAEAPGEDAEVQSAEEPAEPPAVSREPAEPPPLESSLPQSPAASAPATATDTGKPPVLVGVRDNPWTIVVGATGLFLAIVLLALAGPSLPVDEPGARTSDIAFSDGAQQGQLIYASLACVSCHTQMVRPVVADVGIGAVTLSDTNQILGTRRYGPDLSDIGSRMSATQMESVISGGGGHPGHSLSGDDMEDLISYLLESATSVPGGEDAEGGSGADEGGES